jgi:hypothetical protein
MLQMIWPIHLWEFPNREEIVSKAFNGINIVIAPGNYLYALLHQLLYGRTNLPHVRTSFFSTQIAPGLFGRPYLYVKFHFAWFLFGKQ